MSTNKTIPPDIKAILERSNFDGNKLFLSDDLPDRSLYLRVAKFIELAGGKWEKKVKAHVFPSDARETVGMMVETGSVEDRKQAFQIFYTPDVLATRLAELAQVDGKTVLEPSAGEGSIANACMTEGAQRVNCVEIRPEAAEVLRKKGYVTVEGDFLLLKPEPSFDRVVMNPPFTRNQDIAHVAHALMWLKPGGTLISVMSPNLERPKLKALLRDRYHRFFPVAPGAFSAAGTDVATVILQVSI